MKQVTAALLLKDGKILIARRPENDDLANCWEFPGGKIEKGETPEACLIREMKEELNIDVNIGSFFMESIFNYQQGTIQLLSYWITWQSGELKPIVHSEVAWVDRDELINYEFAPADIPIVKRLLVTDFLNKMD